LQKYSQTSTKQRRKGGKEKGEKVFLSIFFPPLLLLFFPSFFPFVPNMPPRFFFLICLIVFGIFSCRLQTADSQSIPLAPDSLNTQILLASLEEAPSTPEVFYQKARIYLQKKQGQKALEAIDLALAEDNSQPKFYLLRAKVYQSQYKPTLALADAEKSLTLQLTDPELFTLLGELYYGKGDYLKALKSLQKTLAIAPYSAQAWFWKGKVALAVNDTIQATGAYRKTLQYNPRYIEAYQQLALIFNALHNLPQAAVYLEKGLQTDSTRGSLWLELAENRRLSRQPDSVVALLYEKAVYRDPSLLQAWLEAGKIAFAGKNYLKTISRLEKIEKYPDRFPEMNAMLAVSYEAAGQWEKALEKYAWVVSHRYTPEQGGQAMERYVSLKDRQERQRRKAYLDSLAIFNPALLPRKEKKTERLELLEPK
jgi:tetratricopeptide (TPR) repeat protein